MWNDLIAGIGAATETVVAPVAHLLEPLAGDAAWGWSVLLIGAAWRLPTWPWLVRSADRRIARQRAAATPSDEQPSTGPGRRDAFARIGTVFAVAQVTLIVIVALWSRTGPSAVDASFHGLPSLAASPVSQGVGGISWAAALAILGTTAGLLAGRAAGVDDDRQRFFVRYLAPVIFGCLGLFLPAAMVIPFVGAMALNLAATARVAGRAPTPTEVAA